MRRHFFKKVWEWICERIKDDAKVAGYDTAVKGFVVLLVLVLSLIAKLVQMLFF